MADITSLSREKFVSQLLEAMCWMAENADEKRGCGFSTDEIEFKSFRPSAGDKLIFRRIIEESYSDLNNDFKTKLRGGCSLVGCALSILNMLYAPKYLSLNERVINHSEFLERQDRLIKYYLSIQ